MEEPPEILAENAYHEFAPEDETARVARFMQAAVAAGVAKPGKKPGQIMLGKRTVDPERLEADFAGLKEETLAYRRLLASLAEGPGTCRARVTATVSLAQARKALGKEAALEEVTAVVGGFEIAVRYYSEKQVLGLFVVDLATGKPAPELLESVRALPGAASKPMKAGEVEGKRLEKAMERLRKLAAERADGLYQLVRTEVASSRAERRAAMEGYFEGLDQEYEREERRMYYHLYYFDQQEKLAEKRAADMVERQQLVQGAERYYQLETLVRPVGLALLALPVYRAGSARLCGLTGRTL